MDRIDKRALETNLRQTLDYFIESNVYSLQMNMQLALKIAQVREIEVK